MFSTLRGGSRGKTLLTNMSRYVRGGETLLGYEDKIVKAMRRKRDVETQVRARVCVCVCVCVCV
jgi:hypothetical protein